MNEVSIRLTEWQEVSPQNNATVCGVFLDDSLETRSIAEGLTDSGIIRVSELREGLFVGASSYVGRVRLGSLQITVYPKLGDKRLFHLLGYAYGLRNFRFLPKAEYSRGSALFQDLLLKQLACEVSHLISRDLLKRYARVETELSSPRGRIDLQNIVKLGGVYRTRLPCVHYLRLEDCLLNQVVLAGLSEGARLTDDIDLKSELRGLVALMQDSVTSIKLNRDGLSRAYQQTSRLTKAYDSCMTIIQILVEGEGISLDHGETRIYVPGFLFDMNRFFQALISRFLRENLEGFVLEDEYRLKGMMRYVPRYNPQKRRPPEPRPDYVLVKDSRIMSILDAKYRDLWKKPLPREMLYQLAMYALSHEDVSCATILYPTEAANAQEAKIEIGEARFRGRRAEVVLRPVNLAVLEELIMGVGEINRRQRAKFAEWMAWGQKTPT
jgi:5-methylcytosine-specific restriction enzyme subunit McrC